MAEVCNNDPAMVFDKDEYKEAREYVSTLLEDLRSPSAIESVNDYLNHLHEIEDVRRNLCAYVQYVSEGKMPDAADKGKFIGIPHSSNGLPLQLPQIVRNSFEYIHLFSDDYRIIHSISFTKGENKKTTEVSIEEGQEAVFHCSLGQDLTSKEIALNWYNSTIELNFFPMTKASIMKWTSSKFKIKPKRIALGSSSKANFGLFPLQYESPHSYRCTKNHLGDRCEKSEDCDHYVDHVSCEDGRCLEICISENDPRNEYDLCKWNEGEVPQGFHCTKSSNCLSGLCRNNICTQRCPHNDIWPIADANSTIHLPCPYLFAGTLDRTCDETGSWLNVISTCERLFCAEILLTNTTGKYEWPTTEPGKMVVQGDQARHCIYSGTDAKWGDIISLRASHATKTPDVKPTVEPTVSSLQSMPTKMIVVTTLGWLLFVIAVGVAVYLVVTRPKSTADPYASTRSSEAKLIPYAVRKSNSVQEISESTVQPIITQNDDIYCVCDNPNGSGNNVTTTEELYVDLES